MSQTAVLRDQEVVLSEDEFIVTKTDTRGNILYANRTFMRISGFSEPELLGQPHNMVRHPDMPRAVFQLLWETLRSGDEFFGYVKNRCKDGSYYWVLANITPDRDAAGQLRGYYSVRRKPQGRAIAQIVPLYRRMRELEGQGGVERALQHLKAQAAERGLDYPGLVIALDQEVHA